MTVEVAVDDEMLLYVHIIHRVTTSPVTEFERSGQTDSIKKN